MFKYVNKIDTSITISGVVFPNRIMNAAGCYCTKPEELFDLAKSNSGGIVSKSCTLHHRIGNPTPRYYDTEHLSINSTGLANLGWKFYAEYGTTIKQETTKPYIISIAGIEKDENITILQNLKRETYDFDMIELNLSCPNIIGKPQIGYDFDASDELLRKVFELNPSKPLGLKLPPYFDMCHFNSIAEVLKQYPISYITCINSPGNGFVFNDTMNAAIVPKGGFGGIGGSVVKPFGLSNVRKLHELLPDIHIIGCGGIKSIKDICEYLACGASLVQIGTHLLQQGPGLFKRLLIKSNFSSNNKIFNNVLV